MWTNPAAQESRWQQLPHSAGDLVRGAGENANRGVGEVVSERTTDLEGRERDFYFLRSGSFEMSEAFPETLISAIRRAYESQDYAVEPILTSANRRETFVATVRALAPGATEDEVLEHLVALRKRGAENGGLPRKKR
jgi:hypothetical protein